MSNALPGCSRIRWLVGAHLVLAAAPILGMGFEPDVWLAPLVWALVSLPFGSLMTMSVWVGLGRARLLSRVVIGLAASFYLTIWPFVNEAASLHESMSWSQRLLSYLEAVGPFVVLLFLFSGVFMLLGLRFKLAHVERDAMPTDRRGLRFSMLQIMVVMSVAALVLSLARATRESHAETDTTWGWLIFNAFLFVVFIVNTVSAAFAALGPSNVKRNVGMVVIVSLALGFTMAVALRNEAMLSVFVGTALIGIVPTLMVLASLLVVRSCGYRLIRRDIAMPVAVV